jgi:hypothetical protein
MKRWFLENLGLKLLALFIALALWAYVGSRQVLERREKLPLELTDIPAGMKVDPSVKPDVSVVFRGRKDSVLEVDPADLKAVVSLTGYPIGKREMRIQPIVKVPPGVSADAQSVTIRLLPLAEPSEKTKVKRKSRR